MTEDLLERYFRKECTPEEEQQVREYLREHMSHLENDLTEEDWASFHYKDPLPPFVSDKMLSVINNSTHPKKTRRIIIRWSAAAAAVILLSAGAWIWATKAHHSSPEEAPIAAIHPAKQQHWTERSNHSGKTIHLVLPDSSKVELASQSAIRYEDSFTSAPRILYLTGKALFNVVSDSARPFTVYGGGLTTTALATEFSVACPSGQRMTTEVSLLSGKVIVRPDSLLRSQGIKETLLHPGQRLTFDPMKQTVMVHSIRPASPIQPGKLPVNKTMQFNNTTLKDIFATLEKEYHCRFIYDNPDIDNIRFTGSFNSNKETLSDFLNTIALLNNLTLTEKNANYYLK